MTELLAKLTNLSYELFGVILPGVVAGIFLLLWWYALGPLAPLLTFNSTPELTLSNARAMIDSLNAATGAGVAVPAFVLCYFLGHFVLWTRRSGPANDDAAKCWYKRLRWSLIFRIPKPSKSYDPKLERLYRFVQAKFSKETLEWREFYPVVKSFLSQNVANSLVSTYQNKYTLHGSIATAASALFWLSVFGLLFGLAIPTSMQAEPHYVGLSFLAISGLILVGGFSSSYIFHWEMFGNTIITEAYSRLYGPEHGEPKKH